MESFLKSLPRMSLAECFPPRATRCAVGQMVAAFPPAETPAFLRRGMCMRSPLGEVKL